MRTAISAGRAAHSAVKTVLFRQGAILAVILAIGYGADPLLWFVHVGAALYALRSPKAAVQAVTISWFTGALNPAIATATSGGHWLVLAFAIISCLAARAYRHPAARYPTYALLAFGMVALASAIGSAAPALVILKAGSFLGGAWICLVGPLASRSPASYWFIWMLGLTAWVVLLSVPTLALPLGYLRNQRGFQGILDHPQALGLFLAPGATAAAIAAIRWRRGFPIAFASSGALFAFIWATQSRTALLAVVISLLLASALSLSRSLRRHARFRTTQTRKRFLGLSVLLSVVVAWLGPFLAHAIADFMNKWPNQAASGLDFYQGSRGSLIATSMDNFATNPLLGIGFGLPSTNAQLEAIRFFAGVPISAPTEKGFFLSATLEEVGALGLLSMVAIIVSVLVPILRRRDPVISATVFTALLFNGGEMVFYALGGMGTYMWLWIGVCYAHSTPQPDSRYFSFGRENRAK